MQNKSSNNLERQSQPHTTSTSNSSTTFKTDLPNTRRKMKSSYGKSENQLSNITENARPYNERSYRCPPTDASAAENCLNPNQDEMLTHKSMFSITTSQRNEHIGPKPAVETCTAIRRTPIEATYNLTGFHKYYIKIAAWLSSSGFLIQKLYATKYSKPQCGNAIIGCYVIIYHQFIAHRRVNCGSSCYPAYAHHRARQCTRCKDIGHTIRECQSRITCKLSAGNPFSALCCNSKRQPFCANCSKSVLSGSKLDCAEQTK